MKQVLAVLWLTLTGFSVLAGEPVDAKVSPGKPIKLKAVAGRRENISIPGEFAGFRCYPASMVCFWKIVTEGVTDSPLECETTAADINPESFPAVFEPGKLYLGVYDQNKTLRVIEVNSIDMNGCDTEAPTVIISPRVDLDF